MLRQNNVFHGQERGKIIFFCVRLSGIGWVKLTQENLDQQVPDVTISPRNSSPWTPLGVVPNQDLIDNLGKPVSITSTMFMIGIKPNSFRC